MIGQNARRQIDVTEARAATYILVLWFSAEQLVDPLPHVCKGCSGTTAASNHESCGRVGCERYSYSSTFELTMQTARSAALTASSTGCSWRQPTTKARLRLPPRTFTTHSEWHESSNCRISSRACRRRTRQSIRLCQRAESARSFAKQTFRQNVRLARISSRKMIRA